MKYCKITTESHPISLAHPTCIEDINLLLVNEGYDGTLVLFNSNEVVLNLDCVETKIANDEAKARSRSMDFSFGIANGDKSIKLMVLVELKLNQKNPNWVKREYLEEKVAGSALVLKNDIHIYANYIFIFRSDRKQEAINRFFRMNPRIPNEYLVMDLQELHDTFF